MIGKLNEILLAMTLVTTSSSCTYLKEAIGLGPKKPLVKVHDIRVKNVGLDALELLVRIKIDNPNGFDLTFAKLRYGMTSADMQIAKGSYDKTVTIPAEGASFVELPVAVDPQNVVKLAKLYLTGPSDLFAVVTATADFETPVGAMEVSFENKHRIAN